MNWTDFFQYLTLLYLVYYAVNVVIDVLHKPRIAEVSEGNAYTFQTDLSEFGESPQIIEDDDPIIAEPRTWVVSPQTIELENSEDDSEKSEFEINDSSPVKSTGGVGTLDSLFALAKEGTIEMKKKVVYS